MGKMNASQGWHWVGAALHMARRWPAVFPVMGLIVAVIALIPWVGGLVVLFLGPALIAGTIRAAHTVQQGGTPAVGDLFSLFREGEHLGPALALCLPVVIGQVLSFFVILMGAMSALHHAGIDVHSLQSDPQKFIAVMSHGPMLICGLLALVIMLLAYGFLFTAIARVGLDKHAPFPAMGESFGQMWRHLGVWLIMMLTLFLCMFIPASIGMLIGLPTLAELLVYIVLYTLLGPTLYAAYRTLLGTGAGDATSDRPRAPPPSFEA